MKATQLFGSESGDGRGVSPVIGVILMVAITVILSAVIATFVLGLGDQVQASPQAGVSFEVTDSTGIDVRLTLISEGNIDTSTISINTDCGGGAGSAPSAVGGSTAVTGCSNGNSITVTADTNSGSTGVIAQYTVGN